jgi:SAM-dependent methyltransferase
MRKTAMNEDVTRTTGISSWYDGLFYSAIISPTARWLMSSVAELIEENSRVLDVGCGVGQLAFILSVKCKQVTGIDFSRRMVEYASKQKTRRNLGNVDFVYGDAARVSEIFSQSFDYVTAIMCLHEMDYQSRHWVIAGCLELTDQVILVDYASPFPRNIVGAVQTLIELSGGKRHYAGFRDWQERGGMDGFIKQENLDVQMRKPWQNRIGETVIVSGRNQ